VSRKRTACAGVTQGKQGGGSTIVSDERLCSKARLAELLGLSLKTIDHMVRKGCPAHRNGAKGKPWQFDVAAVARWREQQAVANAPRPKVVDLDALKAQKMQLDIEAAELELARQRGDVVAVESTEQLIDEVFSTLRSRFLQLPSKLAPRVIRAKSPAKAQTLLDIEVRQILEELSTGDFVVAAAAKLDGFVRDDDSDE